MKVTRRQLQRIITESLSEGSGDGHIKTLERFLKGKGISLGKNKQSELGPGHCLQDKRDGKLYPLEAARDIIAVSGPEGSLEFVNGDAAVGYIYRGLLHGIAQQYFLTDEVFSEITALNDSQYGNPYIPVNLTSVGTVDLISYNILQNDTYKAYLNFKTEVDAIQKNQPEYYKEVFVSGDSKMAKLGRNLVDDPPAAGDLDERSNQRVKQNKERYEKLKKDEGIF